MALRDIRPFSNGATGQYGRIIYAPLNAAETFLAGEPVAINADGEVTESADNPAVGDVIGIAMAPVGPQASEAGFNNPRTGLAWTTGDAVPIIVADGDTLFVTSNFSSAGAAFGDVSPATTHIGDEAGLSLISGSWGVDISASNNHVRIVDVLDANNDSITFSGGTGTQVVFKFAAVNQWQDNPAPVA